MRRLIPVKLFIITLTGLGSLEATGSNPGDFSEAWLMVAEDLEMCLGRQVPRVPHGIWAGAGQGLLFSMPELPMAYAALSLAGEDLAVPWRLGFTWQETGREFFKQRDLSGLLWLGDRWRVGFHINDHRVQLDGKVAARRFDHSLLVSWPLPLGGVFRARVRAAIAMPRTGAKVHPVGRRDLFKLTIVRPGGGGALRVDLGPMGEPLLALECLWVPVPGIGLGWRADPETASLGPSLVWCRGPLILRSSHVAHPDLGVTHRFFLTVGQAGVGLW